MCLQGGKAEADAAYEEAMDAVFHLEVDHHCHVQYQELQDDLGQPKPHWDQIEMWPFQVCICTSSLVNCGLDNLELLHMSVHKTSLVQLFLLQWYRKKSVRL